MSLEAIVNRGEYLPAHYLAEVFPGALRKDVLPKWRAELEHGRSTPRLGLTALRRIYLDAKQSRVAHGRNDEQLRELHQQILRALGFEPKPDEHKVFTPTSDYVVTAAHSEDRVVALDCGWADDVDAANDPVGAGRLLEAVDVGNHHTVTTGMKLVGHLFASENRPDYVLLLSGGVVTLADRRSWSAGRYLAVNLDLAFARNDTSAGGELDVIAALLGAASLYPPEEGGDDQLTGFLAAGRLHAVGVSGDLREGIRESVELIANEVLTRLAQAGVAPERLMEPRQLGRTLTRESLRYLYRILFLLYAEARPELGVLPVDDPEYVRGYSLSRLGDLVTHKLIGEQARESFHYYESLDLLFRMVNAGHRPRGGTTIEDKASEDKGIRFEPMRSDLFLPDSITLIGRNIVHPDYDPDDVHAPRLDTRLRNAILRDVLRKLMFTKGKGRKQGGFISYAQLGINQLGAVYEGLMSYTGFIAPGVLNEVAKGGDPKLGSWMIPESAADGYPDEVFVRETDDNGRRNGGRVRYRQNSFVYRLAGRDRQTSASYYTPQSLTQVTVQLALKYRLTDDTPARELLDWTICEPALGSGAFLNEAIDQVAAEYLRRRQAELPDRHLDPEAYRVEKQKVKAYIALHNCYGVDLNSTAVELAEVSLWLNVMHRGLQAPWFGLHLRRGNSLIGANRRYYLANQLKKSAWLTTAPTEHPFRDGDLPTGAIHQFLLPADGWGAVVADTKARAQARAFAPDAAAALSAWRRAMRVAPKNGASASQVKRLQALARRVEYLWAVVQRRLEISEREIRRDIDVWEAHELPPVKPEAIAREQILSDLEAVGTPYWRLKVLMDTWCALWFWPLDKVSLLDGTASDYDGGTSITRYETQAVFETREPAAITDGLFEVDYADALFALDHAPVPKRRQIGTRQIAVTRRLNQPTPLKDLDNWLTFAEALIGRKDLSGSLFESYEDLHELVAFEDNLAEGMGMDEANRLAERFPWLDTAIEIAKEQGFFHWELTFAQVFARGGFDLQIGNPPWVRPRWDDDAVLAEFDPWFKLTENATPEERDERKYNILTLPEERAEYLSELCSNAAVVELLTAESVFPLLAKTQPDLYRAFMCRVWSGMAHNGSAGLLHPDTHFGGVKEGPLRAAAYRYLRVHGNFVNAGNWAFKEIGRTREFGIHIYGSPRSPSFLHLSQLYAANVLPESLVDSGLGDAPGQKRNGRWDVRAHSARVITVTLEKLEEWNEIDEDSISVSETPLLFPISQFEDTALGVLTKYSDRLGRWHPRISRGYDEDAAKSARSIRFAPGQRDLWEEIILQGRHIGIASPFAKQPNDPFRHKKDWVPWELADLPEQAKPRTTYERASTRDVFEADQDVWVDYSRLADLMHAPEALARIVSDMKVALERDPTPLEIRACCEGIASSRYTSFYRLAWRRMIDLKSTERSLFAAVIPPGPAHIDAVHTLSLGDNLSTALCAGFWASLPLDYFVRITGRSDLRQAEVAKMPAPEAEHPLAPALLIRTLRLNCLTSVYAPLWVELFDTDWPLTYDWTVAWPRLEPLGRVEPTWTMSTPLRVEYARRAALVEIDALVAVWLGLGIEELLAIYRSRYPILADREDYMYFDATGRRLAADSYAFGFGQTKADWQQFEAHLANPESAPPPDGFTAPFYKADREAEMRKAHKVFSDQLAAAEESA